jgi:hypothetical protein
MVGGKEKLAGGRAGWWEEHRRYSDVPPQLFILKNVPNMLFQCSKNTKTIQKCNLFKQTTPNGGVP